MAGPVEGEEPNGELVSKCVLLDQILAGHLAAKNIAIVWMPIELSPVPFPSQREEIGLSTVTISEISTLNHLNSIGDQFATFARESADDFPDTHEYEHLNVFKKITFFPGEVVINYHFNSA